MEPPGGVPPDRDRQLVLRNSAAQATPVPMPQCVKPTTLSLQPQPQLAAVAQQLSPAASGNNNTSLTTSMAALVATSSGGGSGNANSGTSPALASTATAISATTQAATAFSGSSVGHHHPQHHQHPHAHAQAQVQAPAHPQPHHPHHGSASALLGGSGGASQQSQPIEKLSRPMAFDKMEALVREMQDQEHGVPVRQQKMFLTSIPYAFMGYDLIEWLMDRLQIEESEALNIANQLCLHGYFFPVNDSKTLTVKDDSSLYRFQTPYYWPWQHKAPDNVEYAIYLAKRSLRNKQRHALEDYEAEALASLHKNLKGKWDFISMQAEEQVRLAKERKKGDKIVGDSQERAYWRVHRPPPGQFTPLEPCPVPSRDRQGLKPNKKKTVDDMQRDVDYLGKSLNRTRMKMSQACESLVCYSETFAEYDFFLHPALPSNPWVTEDIAFWQLNSTFVDIPTEKRVKRWAISIEELVSDPTGLQEFTSFLEKEYSHENIRFWTAVNRLRRSAHSQVARKVNEIYEEFLKPGAPCEINIDGKTMESVLRGLKQPSRFTFDSASEHIYMLLLKKDCYPRFIRSDHYKRLLESGIQPSHKKRFFNFGGVSGAKKKMTAALSSQPNLGDAAKGGVGGGGSGSMMQAPPPGSLSRRRGSDRSLTGSAHELAVIGVNKDAGSKVPHSHSQSNLSEMPYSSDSIYRGDMPQRHMDAGIYAAYGNRESSLQTLPEIPKTKPARLETTVETSTAALSSAVCPWDEPTPTPTPAPSTVAQVKLSVCPWEQESETAEAGTETEPATATAVANVPIVPIAKASSQRLTSTSSDNSEVAERLQRNLGIRHQNTVDSGEAGMKRLMPSFTEQRRASVSFTPSRNSDYQFGRPSTTTPSPTVGSQSVVSTIFPPPATSAGVITKDPPSGSDADAEIEDELNKLSLSERNSESSASELPVIATPTRTPTHTPTPTPTPPPITKITPPPEECAAGATSSILDLRSESPSESAQAEAAPAEVATLAMSPLVKEVQIELIETEPLEQLELASSTPTIKVASPTSAPLALEEQPTSTTESGANSPVPQQQQLEGTDIGDVDADAEVEVEVELEGYGAAPEELSPTTDEYQEGKQLAYDYDIVDTDRHLGYIPPAPTPAHSMAPLAELDVDTVDDECDSFDPPVEQAPAPAAAAAPASGSGGEEVRRRRKKRNADGKKLTSLDDKEKASTSAEGARAQAQAGGEADHNAVCPWEDENVSTSDGTFVKTYATLGYL